MEYVKIKCKKCGYELEMPEKSGSVICGSCGKINTFGRFSSKVRLSPQQITTPAQQDNRSSSIKADIKKIPGKQPADISKPSYKPVQNKMDMPEQSETPVDEEEYEFPEQKTASKILTLIFILAPFIAMAVEFFKLPPFAAVAVIMLIVVIALVLKKRS